MKIVKQKENIFHKGYPEVIVFSQGKVDVEGFEKLTGIKYSQDENLDGYPLFRADLELSELMSLYEKRNWASPSKDGHLDAMRTELIELMSKQEWDTALHFLKELLKRSPLNMEYLLILGDCLIQMDKHRLLYNFYNRLLKEQLVSAGDSLQLLNKLGEAYWCQKRFIDAEKLFQNVLHLNPNDSTALNNLGCIRFNQNRALEAVNCFQKALEADPNNKDAIANLERLKV